MSERCPRCGAKSARGSAYPNDLTLYECGSWKQWTEVESEQCLRNQLAQAKERIKELERDLDDESEDEKRSGDRIVALLRENEQLHKRIAVLQKSSLWQLQRIEELAQERDTIRAKLDDLLSQRMDEAEAKLATRPAEAVVGELEAENRRLREVAERVVRANKDVDRHGYASLRRMVYALENVLREVQG